MLAQAKLALAILQYELCPKTHRNPYQTGFED